MKGDQNTHEVDLALVSRFTIRKMFNNYQETIEREMELFY